MITANRVYTICLKCAEVHFRYLLGDLTSEVQARVFFMRLPYIQRMQPLSGFVETLHATSLHPLQEQYAFTRTMFSEDWHETQHSI